MVDSNTSKSIGPEKKKRGKKKIPKSKNRIKPNTPTLRSREAYELFVEKTNIDITFRSFQIWLKTWHEYFPKMIMKPSNGLYFIDKKRFYVFIETGMKRDIIKKRSTRESEKKPVYRQGKKQRRFRSEPDVK